MTDFSQSLGVVVLLIGWGVVTLAILSGVYGAIWLVGRWMWKRLGLIYHLSVVAYQLYHLEKLGTHKFMRANGKYEQ